MKALRKIVFICSALFISSWALAQQEIQSTTSEPHKNLRADKIEILLVKEIENLGDTAKHHHHHDPHKSSFRIVHLKFVLTSNDPTITGNKTILMRIIDPMGHDIYDIGSGGGLFMLNKKETPYTYKYTGNFDGKSMNVDFLYKHTSKFKKGIHIIEFYVDGKKIGEEHFLIQ
ncbi:MAG: hypothetical protein MUE33_06150 [Cytophagaceae bacterium]|jgi:hypothetical protein|nr:hypothetical protein [Cytophagaceae bacterium]